MSIFDMSSINIPPMAAAEQIRDMDLILAKIKHDSEAIRNSENQTEIIVRKRNKY